MAGRTSEKDEGKEVTLDMMFQPIVVDFPARLDEYVITGQCSICGNNLTREFPEDFPKEWRWCCFCKLVAETMVEGDCLKGRCFERRVGKLGKLINLVG